MLLRRLLGIVVLSIAVVIPAAGDEKADKEKAVADAKAAVDKAEKAAKDAKEASDKAAKASADKPTDEPLKKAAADAKTALEKADKAVTEAKATFEKADKALKDLSPEKKDKEKATLKWKFEKGKDFYQKMTTKTTQNMTVMNNKVTQVQEQTFFFKWSVVDVKGDDVVLKQKIEGVVMNIDIGNQKIAYDSTKDKDAAGAGTSNPLADFFKALKDSEFEITLDTKAMKVTKITGRQEFVEKLAKQNPQMKQLLETILSEEALKQMALPTFAAIPGKEVTAGDKATGTWTNKTELDMGPIGKYVNEYTYTYEGKNSDKLDKIKVETSLKYTPPSDAVGGGTGGLPFKIKSADLKSTKAEGTVEFSDKEGRIVKSSMKLKLSGKLSIEIGGQTTEVDLDQDQDSSVENDSKSFVPSTEKK